MGKKLTFDKLPAAVEKILEILMTGESGHTALPELVQRIVLLEKKIDHLEKTLSPNRPVMDKHAVIKVLKIRPKVLNELEMSGVLPSHTEGRKTLYYESDVVKLHMNQGSWKSAVAEASKPAPAEAEALETVPVDIPAEGHHRVDVNGASVLLDRSAGAIRQQISTNNIPYHKDGRRVYFYTDELREWAKAHPPLKRKPKS
jgi:hypothetical protein